MTTRTRARCSVFSTADVTASNYARVSFLRFLGYPQFTRGIYIGARVKLPRGRKMGMKPFARCCEKSADSPMHLTLFPTAKLSLRASREEDSAVRNQRKFHATRRRESLLLPTYACPGHNGNATGNTAGETRERVYRDRDAFSRSSARNPLP